MCDQDMPMASTPASRTSTSQVTASIFSAESNPQSSNSQKSVPKKALASKKPVNPSDLRPARINITQPISMITPEKACSALIESTGARVYMPHVHETRARLAHGAGDEAAFERELRQAQRLFAKMGATGHAERVARELAALS